MIELYIDEPTPSLNEMLRQHWAIDVKLKAHWSRLVMCAVSGKVPPAPIARARITITRISPRMLDWDNCAGGTKHLTDGLRTHGVISDDTPEHVELIVRQEKGKAATRVQIEPLVNA